jgi:hypothetical protein
MLVPTIPEEPELDTAPLSAWLTGAVAEPEPQFKANTAMGVKKRIARVFMPNLTSERSVVPTDSKAYHSLSESHGGPNRYWPTYSVGLVSMMFGANVRFLVLASILKGMTNRDVLPSPLRSPRAMILPLLRPASTCTSY